MCVIYVADTVRPSREMVEAGFESNPAGAGIAWREDGFVKWKKGLEIAKIADLVATLPIPFVVHFRIPSVGGPSKKLTHPFPLNDQVGLEFEGETEGQVLFHNGTWSQWKTFSLETAVSLGPERKKLPAGLWSDSRALAWNANVYGPGILELIDEKVVLFGPTGEIQIFGSGWSEEEGCTVSNRGWISSYKRTKNYNNITPLKQIYGSHKIHVEEKPPSNDQKQSGKSGGTSQDGTFRTVGGNETVQSAGESSREDLQECLETGEGSIPKGFEDRSKPIICIRETIGYHGPAAINRSKDDDDTLEGEIVHVIRGDVSSDQIDQWARSLNPKVFHGGGKVILSEAKERQRRIEAHRKQGIIHQGRL